jgi:hypothetical protein
VPANDSIPDALPDFRNLGVAARIIVIVPDRTRGHGPLVYPPIQRAR